MSYTAATASFVRRMQGTGKEEQVRAIVDRFAVTEQSMVAQLLADANDLGKFDNMVELLEPYGKDRQPFTGDHPRRLDSALNA